MQLLGHFVDVSTEHIHPLSTLCRRSCPKALTDLSSARVWIGAGRFDQIGAHLAINPAQMKTSRLEAFSDGVLAIIITIMVLELKVPHATELAALKPMLPVLL